MKKKKSLSMALMSGLLLILILPLEAEKSKPGAWVTHFGSPPPEPGLFLPEIIASKQHEYVLRPIPGQDEFILMRSDDRFNTSEIRFVRVNETWRQADALKLNFSGQMAYPAFTGDGQLLFFTGLLQEEAPDLWVSKRNGDAWSEPRRLPEEINSPAVEMYGTLADSGNLYFSSNRSGGYGDFDLYLARRTGTGYAPAENLGPTVNSREFEAHPFIAADESYLLFDARRAEGMGQNDIYISHRKPDGSWSKAVMLKYPGLNGPAGDMRPSVSRDGSILWFCSDRLGSQDIFWVDWKIVDSER